MLPHVQEVCLCVRLLLQVSVIPERTLAFGSLAHWVSQFGSPLGPGTLSEFTVLGPTRGWRTHEGNSEPRDHCTRFLATSAVLPSEGAQAQ